MSGKIMGKVWDYDLPHNQAYVLLAMADHADHLGNRIFPGLPLIAWKTGYSVKQVRRIVKELVTAGVLVEQSARPGKAKMYSIDFSKAVPKPEFNPSQNVPTQNVTPDILTPDPGHAPVQNGTLTVIEDKNRQKRRARKSSKSKTPYTHPLLTAYLETFSLHSVMSQDHTPDDQRQQYCEELESYGVTPDGLQGYIAYLYEQDFWRDKTVTLKYCAEKAAQWLKANGNGHTTETIDLLGYDLTSRPASLTEGVVTYGD